MVSSRFSLGKTHAGPDRRFDEEVAVLRGDMMVSVEAHSDMAVTEGIEDVKLVPAKCGVGKVNATICAQMLKIPTNRSDRISGVAEGLVRIMAFGDMVIGSSKATSALAAEMEGRRLAIFAVF